MHHGFTKTILSIIFSFYVLFGCLAFAQNNGKIEGVITDVAKDQALTGANVQIVGSQLGAATDEDGYYLIPNVPAGDYQVEFTFLGYETIQKSVTVEAGQSVQMNIALKSLPLSLDEILVISVREKADSPVSTDVITEEEIEASRHAGAYDVFKHEQGVFVVKSHAIGTGLASKTAGRIMIRGLGRRSGGDLTIRGIQVLVDGIPDFSQTHGHPFPDVHALDNIESIEIVKGPSSVRHGNAMSGAIIMTTKTPGPGTSYFLRGTGGSFGTTENVARVGYGSDKGYAQISGNLRHTEGHRDNLPDALTAYNGSAKLGYKLSPKVMASFNGMVGHFNWDNPGPAFTTGGETDWKMGDLNFNYSSERNNASLKLWGVDGDVTFNNGTTEPNTSFGAKSKIDLGFAGGNKVTLGFDWMNYEVGRNDQSTGHFNEVAPYAIIEHHLTNKVFLEGGVRFTHNEQFGDDVSPELGAVYRLSDETAIRARAAHGFRTPNGFETTLNGNANPDLDAADLWQYEVGVNQTIAQRVTVDVVAFLQEGDNMIRKEPDPNSPSGSRLANTGKFSHKGIESALSIRLAENLAFTATTTNLDLEDDTALSPHNFYTGGLAFTPGQVTLSVDARMVTGLYNKDKSQDKLDNFTVLDFQANYKLQQGISLFLSVDNFLDEDYELAKGFPMPGIGVYGGVSLKR